MESMIVKIDSKIEVRFNYNRADVDHCSTEISRFNSHIKKMRDISNSQIIPVVIEKIDDSTIDMRFNSESLMPEDLADIKKYIQIVIRASATNRIMESKAGIVAAKTRLKEII